MISTKASAWAFAWGAVVTMGGMACGSSSSPGTSTDVGDGGGTARPTGGSTQGDSGAEPGTPNEPSQPRDAGPCTLAISIISDDCTACAQTNCCARINACFNDSECKSFEACLQGC